MLRKVCVAVCLIGSLAVIGCAKKAEDIAAAYVSPIAYQGYTCNQIGQEAQRVASRVTQLSGIQDSKHTGDAVKMTVGLVIFWPTLLMIDGNDAQTAELARLKGEMDALQQASIQKNCGIQFQQYAPPPPRPEFKPQGFPGVTS